MVTYGVEALVQAGIQELMLVTGGTHAGEFLRLLGNGHAYGVERLFYAYQEREGGVAEALGLAERFVGGDRCCVLLADNVFERELRPVVQRFEEQERGARIVSSEIEEEHLRHLGVAELDGERIVRIVEKPPTLPADSELPACTSASQVWDVLPTLVPSGRGELEITDVISWYLERDRWNSVIDGYWGTRESIDAYYSERLREKRPARAARVTRRRFLVTGAAGFIGSNFVRYWEERHSADHLVALDLLTYAGDRRNLDGLEVRLVVGDIGDLELVEALLEEEKIDVVVNFAAESHNSLAVLNPGLFFRTNALGRRLLEGRTPEGHRDVSITSRPVRCTATCRWTRTGIHRGVSVSAADSVQRLELPPPCGQGVFRPLGCGDVELLEQLWARQFPEKVVPLFLTNALDDRELPLYASTQNRREWLHVDDHNRAIELVLERGTVGETYNVGSGIERSIEEIADLVLELTGKPETLKSIVPDRPGHDRRYLLDSSKLRRELGWEPDVDFEEGLRRTVDWYRENRSWWEPLKERAPVPEATAWR
jgi:dTDP-glucose 4,6-dehydratase